MNGGERAGILTGASGGIGQALARALAPHYSALLLVGREAARLGALQAALRASHPALKVEVAAGDLTHGGFCAGVARAARALDAPVKLLVNNAGISEFHAYDSQDFAAIERILTVNLVAPMRLTQALLPLLRTEGDAQIVNVGSTFGYLGYPGFAAYCASKFGLRGFTQALRRELADTGISVRYFAPRATRTSLNAPAVNAMNRELRVSEDEPETVARELMRFLAVRDGERRLGFPERLYVLVNQLVPRVTDRAIAAQLARIRRHLPGGSAVGPAVAHAPADE